VLTINNLEDMKKFANVLVKNLNVGSLILLNGDLGAGKTTLTQFIGKSLGVKRTINSPTFNIIKSYRGSELKLHHMDCYRLEDQEDDLGFDEYFEDKAIIVIEWSEFIKDLLPNDYLSITINVKDENKRLITIDAHGDEYKKIKGAVLHELSSN